MKTALLVIDDDSARADELCLLLRFLEEQPVTLSYAERWQGYLESNPELRCVFLGYSELDDPLIGTIEVIRNLAPRAAIVVITETNQPRSLPTMLEATQLLYLTRPFQYAPLSQILAKTRQATQRDSKPLLVSRRHNELFRSLIGDSPSIHHVHELILRVAPSESTVMILGESGTGKEVVARNVHYHSSRSQGPFVPVNCGAIPENLLESELFGHEKGAFTGAISTRRGRFELARGGTLFLDEIGDMPLSMQVKLLRVLQERSFERVGSDRSIETDVRVITATHRNLEELIERGDFREDLYYRLNVFPIEMPTLRERIEDLPLLVNELLQRITKQQGNQVSLAPAALHCLAHYPWPGNVRELANLMERLAILKPEGRVELDDLPAKFRAYYPEQELVIASSTPTEQGREHHQHKAWWINNEALTLPPDGLDLRKYIMELETSLIQSALEDTNGVVAHAASLLNMRRTTLVEKMRKYSIKRSDEAE